VTVDEKVQILSRILRELKEEKVVISLTEIRKRLINLGVGSFQLISDREVSIFLINQGYYKPDTATGFVRI
jgi:hypothetical protein